MKYQVQVLGGIKGNLRCVSCGKPRYPRKQLCPECESVVEQQIREKQQQEYDNMPTPWAGIVILTIVAIVFIALLITNDVSCKEWMSR
jgi:predicted nucleic acid-binding Zn ribbon protein